MKRPYAIAVRAYPAEFRRANGDELIDTALELHPAGWSWRQAASLVVGGFRMRARRGSGHTPQGALVAGVRLGVFVLFAVWISGPIAHLLGAAPDLHYAAGWPLRVAPIIVLALLMVTSRWPAAVAVTAFVVAGLADGLVNRDPLFGRNQLVSSAAFTVVCAASMWWVALRGDGRRAVGPARGLGIIAALSALSIVFRGSDGNVLLVVLFAMVLVALPVVTIDPRPLIAATTCWMLTAALLVPVIGFTNRSPMLAVVATVVAALLGIGSRHGANRIGPDTL